jgi:hypothetical protein
LACQYGGTFESVGIRSVDDDVEIVHRTNGGDVLVDVESSRY